MLFCTTILFASKIDGKWSTTIETDGGSYSFTITYKVDGDKISGVLSSEMGEVIFEEGKVTGDTFTYKFFIDSNELTHEGTVLNDKEIKIKSKGNYGEREFILKKVEEE